MVGGGCRVGDELCNTRRGYHKTVGVPTPPLCAGNRTIRKLSTSAPKSMKKIRNFSLCGGNFSCRAGIYPRGHLEETIRAEETFLQSCQDANLEETPERGFYPGRPCDGVFATCAEGTFPAGQEFNRRGISKKLSLHKQLFGISEIAKKFF